MHLLSWARHFKPSVGAMHWLFCAVLVALTKLPLIIGGDKPPLQPLPPPPPTHAAEGRSSRQAARRGLRYTGSASGQPSSRAGTPIARLQYLRLVYDTHIGK